MNSIKSKPETISTVFGAVDSLLFSCSILFILSGEYGKPWELSQFIDFILSSMKSILLMLCPFSIFVWWRCRAQIGRTLDGTASVLQLPKEGFIVGCVPAMVFTFNTLSSVVFAAGPMFDLNEPASLKLHVINSDFFVLNLMLLVLYGSLGALIGGIIEIINRSVLFLLCKVYKKRSLSKDPKL